MMKNYVIKGVLLIATTGMLFSGNFGCLAGTVQRILVAVALD